MTTQELQRYCDPARQALATPWSRGDYTYATDGRVAARVPRLAEVTREDGPNAALLFATWPAEGWMPVPELPPAAERPSCLECQGTGETPTCPQCCGEGEVEWHYYHWTRQDECPVCQGKSGTYPCTVCDGLGTLDPPRQEVWIGSAVVDAALLRRFCGLPDLEVAVATIDLLAVRWTGGDGVIATIAS